MSSEDDLVEFLRARLDEDEAEANKHDPNVDEPTYWLEARCETNYPSASYLHVSQSRALAEVDAKRRIIADLLALQHRWIEDDHWYSCAALTDHAGELLCMDEGRAGGPCDCGRDNCMGRGLRLLALPYAGHPGYRPGWAPDA